jgi:hypothetical protein
MVPFRRACIVAVLFLVTAAPASAQTLPGNEIYLRNNSRSSLLLFGYGAGTAWQPFRMSEAAEVLFKAEQVWIAIGTDELTSSGWPIEKLNPAGSGADKYRWHGFAVRRLIRSTPGSPSQRYEVCWSASLAQWVIRELREPACTSLDPGKVVD